MERCTSCGVSAIRFCCDCRPLPVGGAEAFVTMLPFVSTMFTLNVRFCQNRLLTRCGLDTLRQSLFALVVPAYP